MADVLTLAMAAVYAAGSAGTIVAILSEGVHPSLPMAWKIAADGGAIMFWPLFVTFSRVKDFWK
jgi:hypothetical protein